MVIGKTHYWNTLDQDQGQIVEVSQPQILGASEGACAKKIEKLPVVKAGRPKRGESVPSKTVKTWLDQETHEQILMRGGSSYVRDLILRDLSQAEPVSVCDHKLEVHLPEDVHARVMKLGGSSYVRRVIGQSFRPGS